MKKMCTINEVIAAGYTPNTETSTLGGGGKCLTVNAFLTNFKKEGYELSIKDRNDNQLFPIEGITKTSTRYIYIERISCCADNSNGWVMTSPMLEFSCSQKFGQTTIEITQSFNYTPNLGAEKAATFQFTIPPNITGGYVYGNIVSQSSLKYASTDTPNPYGVDSAQITNGDITIELRGTETEYIENPSPVFQWRADYHCACDYSNVNVITSGSYDIAKWSGKFTLFKDTADEHVIDFSDDQKVFTGTTGASDIYQVFANTIPDTIMEKMSMFGGMSPIDGVTSDYQNATANIEYLAETTQIYQSGNVRPYYFDEINCPETTIRLKSSITGTEQLWAPNSTIMHFYIIFNFSD